MSGWNLYLVALGLAMDAFAVSIAMGIVAHRLHLRHALGAAGLFGLFQAVMPLLGWLLGLLAKKVVEGWEPWVVFVLLSIIGIRMIAGGGMQDPRRRRNPFRLQVLAGLALVTSVDAFSVGVSLSLLQGGVFYPVMVIGLVTFATSFAGIYIGSFFGHLGEQWLEKAAGVLLVLIGIRVLAQHLLAGG